MSESFSYLTPFQQSIRNVLGYDPLAQQAPAAPVPTSLLEQLLAAERARAPGAPEAPEAPRAYGDLEGDSASNPSKSTPSPDQSFRGALNALGPISAVLSGPMAVPTIGASLALSSMAGRAPSFNLGARGYFNALSDIFGLTPSVPNDPVEDDVVSDLPQAEVDPGVDVAGPANDKDPGVDKGGEFGEAQSEDTAETGESKDSTTSDPFKAGGLVPLAGGGKIAIGPGGGLDDLIPTSINGRRAAALSDGEFVMPADVVSMMGDGSSNAGARRLYDMVRQIRESKTGTSRQAGPLPVGEILKRTMS
jgi:hypothetical protein